MDHNTSTINIITERRSNGEYLGLHTTILEDDKALENALLNFLPTDDPRDIIAITILCSTTTENIDLQPFVTDNRHAALTHHDAIDTPQEDQVGANLGSGVIKGRDVISLNVIHDEIINEVSGIRQQSRANLHRTLVAEGGVENEVAIGHVGALSLSMSRGVLVVLTWSILPP